MRRLSHPIDYRSEINFETGETVECPETKDERRSRLLRKSAARRSRLLRKFQTEGVADFIDALSDALCLAIRHCKPYPLHFTLRFIYRESGRADITSTERYTLVDAAVLRDLWSGEKTWSVWQKVLTKRRSDDGIELAFPIKEVIFDPRSSWYSGVLCAMVNIAPIGDKHKMNENVYTHAMLWAT